MDSQNHSGSTELRNSVEASVEHEGYTGDLYCLGCHTVMKTGQIIDKLIKPTDTKELEKLILDVKAKLIEEEKYTEETVVILKTQLSLAENLLTQNPTQDEVDAMKTSLEKALEGLVKKEESTPDQMIDVEPIKPNDKEDTDHKEKTDQVETVDKSLTIFYAGAAMLSVVAIVIARKKKEE